MKTKLKVETEFIVKPENRVVVCIMKADMQLYTLGIFQNIEYKMWKAKAPMVDACGGFTVTAISKCNSNDVFDEAVGRKIAESKAKIKAFKIAKNVWSSIAEAVLKDYNTVIKMSISCAAMEVFETKHKEKLLK